MESEQIIRDLIKIKLEEKGFTDSQLEKFYSDAEKLSALYLTKKSNMFHERGAAFIDGFVLSKVLNNDL